MTSKKNITVVDASQMITTLHESTFRQAQELLGKHTGKMFKDGAGQFMLMLWFEAALLTVLVNKRHHELAAKIRQHRVMQLSELFGIETELIENVLDTYKTTQNRAAQFGANNFMLNHLLLFMETPEDQLLQLTAKFDIMTGIEFSELMLRHAKAVSMLPEHYTVK